MKAIPSPETFLLGDVQIDGGQLDHRSIYLWWHNVAPWRCFRSRMRSGARSPCAAWTAVTLQLLDRRGGVAAVHAAHGEHAPERILERKQRHGAAVVPPQIDAPVIELSAVDLDVAEQKCFRLGIAFVGDGERLPHKAAGAVAAGEIRHPYFLYLIIGVAQLRGDAVAVLR